MHYLDIYISIVFFLESHGCLFYIVNCWFVNRPQTSHPVWHLLNNFHSDSDWIVNWYSSEQFNYPHALSLGLITALLRFPVLLHDVSWCSLCFRVSWCSLCFRKTFCFFTTYDIGLGSCNHCVFFFSQQSLFLFYSITHLFL